MISKAYATDGSYNTFYWGKNLNVDINNLNNYNDLISARQDYSGKANTAAIITAYAENNIDMDNRDMCKVMEDFNGGTNPQSNEGFTD